MVLICSRNDVELTRCGVADTLYGDTFDVTDAMTGAEPIAVDFILAGCMTVGMLVGRVACMLSGRSVNLP